MAGTIKVDIDALTTLLQYMLTLKEALDNGKSLVPSLTTQLDAAITGTASSIASFDNTFNGWITLLNTVTTDIDSAYNALNTVLTDAQNAVSAL